MTSRWENSGGDQGFPLERPSRGDFRDPDVDPAERFDAREDADLGWPWSQRLPIGGGL